MKYKVTVLFNIPRFIDEYIFDGKKPEFNLSDYTPRYFKSIIQVTSFIQTLPIPPSKVIIDYINH